MYQFSLLSIINLVVGAWILLMGIFLFLTRRHTYIHLTYFTTAGWILGYGFAHSAIDEGLALFWCKFVYASVIFIAPTMYHFVVVFWRFKKQARYVWINYVIGLIFLIVLFTTPYFIEGVKRFTWGWHTEANVRLHPIFFLFFSAVYGVGLLNLYTRYSEQKKEGSAHEALRTRYFFLIYSISVLGVIDYLQDYGLVRFYPAGFLFAGLGVTVAAYAIIRYKLMDINLAIARATIFAIVYLLVLGIPFETGFVGRVFLSERFGVNWWLIPLAFLGILATVGPFIYLYLERHAENTLLKDQHRYQEILHNLSKEMTLTRGLDKLLELVVHVLTKTIHITYAGVYLYDREKEGFLLSASRGEKVSAKAKAIDKDNPLVRCLLQTRNPLLLEEMKYSLNFANIGKNEMKRAVSYMHGMNATLIIPTYVESEIFAFLVLGDKLSGRIYTEDDLNTLSVLANQTALAIENAQFLKEREALEARLRETEKLRATGEMLGSVRHEMGNLINKASTGMQMMDELYLKGDKEKYNTLRNKIVDNLTSAKAIWKYVDEYKAKSESGKVVSFKLRDIIESALSDSNGLLEKWNIKATTAIDPRISLKGKETLPDIFKHLIINSSYGMELCGAGDKKGELSFSADVNSETGSVEIIQRDTGCDLAKESQGHKLMGGELFAEQGKLGGINLFLARRIIHDHKGTLDIRSNDAKGTKFIIKLPLRYTGNASGSSES